MTTQNMHLTLPLVSQTPGPEWASTLNSNLSLIDSHNHTPGFGALVPTAGLDIDDDLDLNGFGLTTVSSLGLRVPSSPPATASVYSSSAGDLYYTNSAGTPVQITNAGSIVGTTGSISGMTGTNASVAFTIGNSTFTFQSDTNKPGAVDHGPLTIRRNAISSYGIEIQPASGISADWALTLPAADPGATRILGIVSGGQVGYVSTNSTLTLTGSSLTVANSGITATQLASNAVTTAKILDGNVTQAKRGPTSISSSSAVASASTNSTSPVALGLSVAATLTAGYSYRVELVSSAVGACSFDLVSAAGAYNGLIDILVTVPGPSTSTISTTRLSWTGNYSSISVGGVSTVYVAGATGSHTFSIDWYVENASATMTVDNVKMLVYQL